MYLSLLTKASLHITYYDISTSNTSQIYCIFTPGYSIGAIKDNAATIRIGLKHRENNTNVLVQNFGLSILEFCRYIAVTICQSKVFDIALIFLHILCSDIIQIRFQQTNILGRRQNFLQQLRDKWRFSLCNLLSPIENTIQ